MLIPTLIAGLLGCGPEDCANGYGRDADGNCVLLWSGGGVSPPESDDTGNAGAGDDTGDTDPGDDTGDTQPGDDTGDTDPGEELDEVCEAPDDLPDDPIVLVDQWASEDNSPYIFYEGIDLEVDWDNGYIYDVGQGGLVALSFDGSGALTYVNHDSGAWDRYYKLALNEDNDALAVTHRDNGLMVLDVADPATSLGMIAQESGSDYSAVDWNGDLLYAARYDGSLYTYDFSDDELSRLHEMEGLGNPWEILVHGDYLYVADFTQGLTVVDISSPDAPSLVGSVATIGSPQDLSARDDYLFLAAGTNGIEVFSLADPAAPVSVASLDFGGSIGTLEATDAVLWAASHEDVIAIDITAPDKPLALGAQQTEQWAMHVAAKGDRVIVADWGHIEVYDVDTSVRAPESDPSRSELYFYSGSESAELELANIGADTLEVLGATVDDPRFTIYSASETVPPGESAPITVTFEDDGAEVDATLCLATNDPDEPVMEVALLSTSSTGSTVAVGEDAPDFWLKDTEGTTRQLSDHLGQPILLVFFATW